MGAFVEVLMMSFNDETNGLFMLKFMMDFILSPTKKMTTTSEYNYYKQCIDKCVSEMKACKDNQDSDHILRVINYFQRDIQSLYDTGDFDLDLSALEPEPEPELITDGEYTDEQRKLDMEFAIEFTDDDNSPNLNYNFDSDAVMF